MNRTSQKLTCGYVHYYPLNGTLYIYIHSIELDSKEAAFDLDVYIWSQIQCKVSGYRLNFKSLGF